MSAENVEITRRGYEHFLATGELAEHLRASGFVWDMSTFRGWPERQTYESVEGAREFLTEWVSAWEGWRLEVRELIDAVDGPSWVDHLACGDDVDTWSADPEDVVGGDCE